MKVRIVFLICLVGTSVSLAAAQAKTVTNTDLEKYKTERVKGETDLRENYARLGFASPEELARRNEQSAKETAELAARLRAERLERERIEAERAAAAARQPATNYQPQVIEVVPADYGVTYFWSGGRRFRMPFRRPFQQKPFGQQGYFAGGMFIPTGVPPRPGPAWRGLHVSPRR
jgi:hypothetical protein